MLFVSSRLATLWTKWLKLVDKLVTWSTAPSRRRSEKSSTTKMNSIGQEGSKFSILLITSKIPFTLLQLVKALLETASLAGLSLLLQMRSSMPRFGSCLTW